MGIPDSFNPLMGLDHAKNVGEGGIPTGQESAGNAPVERFDGAATNATNIVMPGGDRPIAPSSGFGGPPADVDKFSGGV